MSKREKPPALKHGIYSGMALLPGEDAAEFKKLEKEVMEEFEPVGPLEKDICNSMARLLWRKQHLSSYRLAAEAMARLEVAKKNGGRSNRPTCKLAAGWRYGRSSRRKARGVSGIP